MTRPAASAAALATTLGLAVASWVAAVRQMNGMDMGVATRLGSFVFFVALWLSIAWTIREFSAVRAAAAWLLTPYLIWVGFASALNLAVWKLNQ